MSLHEAFRSLGVEPLWPDHIGWEYFNNSFVNNYTSIEDTYRHVYHQAQDDAMSLGGFSGLNNLAVPAVATYFRYCKNINQPPSRSILGWKGDVFQHPEVTKAMHDYCLSVTDVQPLLSMVQFMCRQGCYDIVQQNHFQKVFANNYSSGHWEAKPSDIMMALYINEPSDIHMHAFSTMDMDRLELIYSLQKMPLTFITDVSLIGGYPLRVEPILISWLQGSLISNDRAFRLALYSTFATELTRVDSSKADRFTLWLFLASQEWLSLLEVKSIECVGLFKELFDATFQQVPAATLAHWKTMSATINNMAGVSIFEEVQYIFNSNGALTTVELPTNMETMAHV